MNIALILSYDGTAYHGWQIQKNGITLQEVVQQALLQLHGVPCSLSGVGRTDAGVHARNYVANYRIEKCTIPMERMPLAVNAYLPPDVAIRAAAIVPDAFDARFHCVRKEYAYDIYPQRIRQPFLERYAYRTNFALDITAMQVAAREFVGKQDFAAVRAVGTPVSSTVRTIFHCDVTEQPNGCLRITVCGDGFLYNMVRIIAGTLLYAGAGKLSAQDIRNALDAGERDQTGPTLPPQGLFMQRLWYDIPEMQGLSLDTPPQF